METKIIFIHCLADVVLHSQKFPPYSMVYGKTFSKNAITRHPSFRINASTSLKHHRQGGPTLTRRSSCICANSKGRCREIGRTPG